MKDILETLYSATLRESRPHRRVSLPSAEDIYSHCVSLTKDEPHSFDRKLDRIVTSRSLGFPIMFLLLSLCIFWLTMAGANYPSAALSSLFSFLGEHIREVLDELSVPAVLISVLMDGLYTTLTWVISVMLPPMAIFFPLFTLLEDFGYLPRIAFNLDHAFRCCGAHGKQSLTMCMGFGCNACGVTGCRIIESPRERLIAVLTNSFVPCNGRFPALIAIILIFFVPGASYMSSLEARSYPRVFYSFQHFHHSDHFQDTFRDRAERRSLFFCVGTAALQKTENNKYHRSFDAGSNCLCPGESCHDFCSFWSRHMAAGQYRDGRYVACLTDVRKRSIPSAVS